VNETWRGLIIFVAALLTLWLWAPLANNASRKADGVIVSETYFGPLRYLTLHTELKEPNYAMERRLHRGRLALTATLSAALWIVVVMKVRGKRLAPPDPSRDRMEGEKRS